MSSRTSHPWLLLQTEAAPVALIALIASYLFIDGLLLLLTSIQLVVYAALAAFVSLLAAFAITQIAIRRSLLRIIVVWLLLTSLFLLPALASEYQYPRYIATDLIATLIPLALLIVGARYPGIFLSRQLIAVLAAAALSGAILSLVIAGFSGRHEPPATLLIAFCWAAWFVAKPSQRTASFLLLAVVLTLAVTSGERTAILVWLIVGLAGWYSIEKKVQNLYWLLGLVILIAVPVVVIFGESILTSIASTRFESLLRGELDESLLNRLLEVRDTWTQWSLAEWYGFGHGATYLPDASYLSRNLTADGRVHNIHFGPMLMLYRYGLVGLLCLSWLIVDLMRFSVRHEAIGFSHAHGFAYLFFMLGLTGYLVSFLMFNVIPDPAFSFVLAGYLYVRFVATLPVFPVVLMQAKRGATATAKTSTV